MIRTTARLLFVGVAAAGSVALAGGPAFADVVTPPGSCQGSGTWVKGGFSESSATHASSDVISIPQSDTVQWAGGIGSAKPGDQAARRAISGSVQLTLPVGDTTIEKWGGTSTKLANTGSHKYDLPSVLVGIKLRLHGQHSDNGTLTCSGSVFLKVEGSVTKNPLLWASIALMVASGLPLVIAGKAVFVKVA